MTRKLSRTPLLLAAMLFFTASLRAQQGGCGTGAPPEAWDSWFNQAVAEQVKKMSAGKSSVVNRIIPVIVHVISYTEAVGTYPNIDSNEVISQIAALNRDFAGIGTNVNQIPGPFASFVSNTGIQFCRASIDFTGSAMVEQGIDRLSTPAKNWESVSNPTLDLKGYMNSVIIPNSIWDPAKYLNIWISDRPPSSTLTSFGTYPPSSGQTGIFGGNVGTTTNDGIWVYTHAFGTMGAALAPNNEGRTTTHELGHYFGLRHIWGDGNCLSDYVGDTPPQKGPTTGCPTGLTPVDECGTNLSPSGRMYMNFMDNTEDACRYMFTHDQSVRMWTALNQSPLRMSLGTHNLCSQGVAQSTTVAPHALFEVVGKACANGPVMLNNKSSGYPYPTYLWSASPAAAFLPNTTSSHPFVNFPSPGNYIVTLVTTNSITSNSYSMVVNVSGSCTAQNVCLDTLKSMKKTDTLTLYNAPVNGQVIACTNSASTGYLTGTNCYQDREYAQYYPATTYTSINYPQVNSVYVLFDSTATQAVTGASVTARIYGGSPASGPSGAMGTPKAESLSNIVNAPKVTSVDFLGKPNHVTPGRKIIAYKFDFDKPVLISSPASGFFAALEIPVNGLDAVAILSDTKFNTSVDSSAWFRNFFQAWKTIRYNRAAKIHLAIVPQISCSPITGISENAGWGEEGVTLMPNPGSGEFTLLLNFREEQEKLFVRVLNPVGEVIRNHELSNVTSRLAQLDLNTESEGIYFIEITNGHQRTVRKLILQH